MFFDKIEDVSQIIKRQGAVILVLPSDVKLEMPRALVVKPEDKSVITIDQMRDVVKTVEMRQTDDLVVIIRPAELMSTDAANLFLKTLEEPGQKVHFVLVTESVAGLLPTILSRAAVYVLRTGDPIKSGIKAGEKEKALAKRLMVAKNAEIVAVAEEITKKKDSVRAYAMTVLGAAIEMLYKSYFLTGNQAFLASLPKFLAAFDGVSQNGNVKIQIIGNLV